MARYEQEQIKPYGKSADGKAGEVEAMFDNIAPTYDKLNHRLSWDIDRYWRRRAISELVRACPRRILDIATGTGDFAIMQAQTIREAEITGIDISEGMMAQGREKIARLGLDGRIRLERADCLALPYESDSFDAVTAAFGIRNFESLEAGLREMYRVLRDGGMLCVVELTRPVSFPIRQLFSIYSHTILPAYGRIVSKDNAAYSYLTATIEAFPQGEMMQDILHRTGFTHATFRRLTFGICTMYVAVK